MRMRPLPVLLAAGLPLAAQPAAPPRQAPPEAERKDKGEEIVWVKPFLVDSHLSVRSGGLRLVVEAGRYGLFNEGAQLTVMREGAGPLVVTRNDGWAISLGSTQKDEAAGWKGILALPAWKVFGDRMAAEDVLALKTRLEAVGADRTRQGQRPFWASWTAQAVADLAWIAQGARGKIQADLPVPATWDATAPVLQEEVHRLGAATLRLTMDATGVSAARAECAFGKAGLLLQKTREGQAIRTLVRFRAADGPEGRFEWVGPWALDPVQTYPEFLAICAASAFAAKDLAEGRALVAQGLAEGPRSPLLRVPLLEALQAHLDALTERVPASAPTVLVLAERPLDQGERKEVDTAPEKPAKGLAALFQTVKAGRLTLSLDQAGYSLLDPVGLQEVDRLVTGRLALASAGGRWSFQKREGEDEAAFWKQVLGHPAGRGCATTLPVKDLEDLRAQVDKRLVAGRRQNPQPAWVSAAGRVMADLGQLLTLDRSKAAPAPVQAKTKAPALPSPVASAVPVLTSPVAAAVPVLEKQMAAAVPVLEKQVAAAVPVLEKQVAAAVPVLEKQVAAAEPVLEKPTPAAAPALATSTPAAEPDLEEKTPAAPATLWSMETRLGDRVDIRASGYDLRLGGLRVAFVLGGSGRDAWVTYTVSDGKGHTHTRTRTYAERLPRRSENVLGALADEFYDAFELQPLIEAWREGGRDWMRVHTPYAVLDDLDAALMDRLEVLAEADPRPADLPATFLAAMAVSRFIQFRIEADAPMVD